MSGPIFPKTWNVFTVGQQRLCLSQEGLVTFQTFAISYELYESNFACCESGVTNSFD